MDYDGWGESSAGYLHGYTPLELHRTLDAHAGLKAVWAATAGSMLAYPTSWQPNAPTLYTSGNFTLGISTAMSKTGAGRVIHAFFGSGGQDLGTHVGEEGSWVMTCAPVGAGGAWAAESLPLFTSHPWGGEEPTQPWERPAVALAWGDPSFCGLPRPQKVSEDPLEQWLPPPWQGPVEEGGIFGWGFPLGVPAATMPKRPG
jgi:hypothetical protein